MSLLPLDPAAVADPGPQSAVTFRVLAFDRPEVFYRPRPEAPLGAIRLHTSAPSSKCSYVGPIGLELFASDSDTAPLFVVDLGTGVRSALILLPPQAADPVAAQPVVVPDDPATVPPGSLTLLNAAGRHFQAEYNGRRLDLLPGARMHTAAAGAAPLVLHSLAAGQWRRVTVFSLELSDDARSWVVLLPPYRADQLQPRWRLIVDGAE